MKRAYTLPLILTLMFLSVESRGIFANGNLRLLSDMAGKIVHKPALGEFISIGDEVELSFDPKLIVKGDRLGVYIKAGTKDNKGAPLMRRIGWLIVLSNSGEKPVGKLISASQEIMGQAYLGHSLSGKNELNEYIPFLQNVADSYLNDPERERLRVALVDVVNPYGDRTLAGDAVFEDLRRYICQRPQFICVKREKLAERLWTQSVKTSRNIDNLVEQDIYARLGAKLIITGHLRYWGGEMDLILRARSTNPESLPRQMWRRFKLTIENPKITPASFNVITVPYKKMERGALRIALRSVGSVEGMRAKRFFYKNLSESYGLSVSDNGAVEAGDFFVRLDGREYPLDMGGMFFNGPIVAGAHHVTIGYYPIVTTGAKRKALKKPIQGTMEISVGAGELLNLDVIGKIENGYAVLVADSYLSEIENRIKR